MVTFKLIEIDENYIVYWYYPEGNEKRTHGIIIVDRLSNEITISKIAEGDWERDISVEELNKMASTINEMKQERGETDYVEMVTKSEHSVYYGDHAINEICKLINQGSIPEKGSQIWY